MERKQILIAGLPNSGKTTYLGALVYILDSGEVNTALKYDGDPENRKYLNKIVNAWLKFERMERTLYSSEEFIELNLLNNDEQVLLRIPDLSGETWKGLWSQRQCSESVANLIEGVDCMMFFIHCDNIEKPISIMEMKRQQEALGEVQSEGEIKDWDPNKHCSTQVMSVDILQIIAEENKNKPPVNLAIILSAWDTVESLKCTPEEFIQSKLPLLSQYLRSGHDYPNFKIYGVSAQGANLDLKGDELKEQIRKLNAVELPSKRVKILSDKDYVHDLSFPIKKLLK